MFSKDELIARLRAYPGLIDAHAHVGIDPNAYDSGSFPYCMSVEDQALRCRTFGIDYAVVFPLLYTSYFDRRQYLKGKFRRDPHGRSPFPFAAENEMLMGELYEVFPRYAGRLLPFMFFDPGRRAAEQAAFIAELAERYPVFGLKTAASYLQSYVRDLLKRGRPLLDVAARLNLPVTLHSAVIPGDPWANVFDLLLVARERPDVRFCLAHTCRFDRRALEQAATLPNCWVDCSAFHIHCQLARENHLAVAAPEARFPADYADHAGALRTIALAYPDTILWGTDTPAHYWIGKFHNDRGECLTLRLCCDCETETTELRKLDEDLIRRLTWTNTCEFLFGA